ncbi:transposase [Pantanalinema rosaneae CENA516]|uniref:transposase n=1 Tax=Pantanalinema rosaneae TaxID=1620701 RepID=UPI003D6DCBF7
MKYNPDNHHRRSIRLKGYDYSSPGAYFITICTHQRQCLFGEIVDGEMRLNRLGQIARSQWLKIPHHHTQVELDAWVIMPNHIHGILILNNPGRGAALGQNLEDPTDSSNPNATPNSAGNQPKSVYPRSHEGVAFGRKPLSLPTNGLPNAAPLPPRLGAGTVGAIVLNFKSVTTRSLNRIQRSPGNSIWQRNYYEHIVRSEESLQQIRQYIQNNPLSWQQEQLHPNNPSKW